MNTYTEFASPSSRKGNAIVKTVVCLDCSPSMYADDWPPSRIEAAKEATMFLIDEKHRRFPRDLVGIVAYGGHAQQKLTLTAVDRRESPKLFRKALDGIAEIGSTNLEAGLRTAARLLGAAQGGGGLLSMLEALLLGRGTVPNQPTANGAIRHIIVLSDGDSNAGNEVAAAEALKRQGIVIDCVGIADRSAVDERKLKAVASLDEHGKSRYRFIGDKAALIKEFGRMAGHLRVM